jgi:hypothetical protein
MKLELDPFLVDIINFEEKNVPVRTDQASTTRGKNVVVSDELKVRMMKPWNLRLTSGRRSRWTWKPTSSFSMEKYVRMRRESVFGEAIVLVGSMPCPVSCTEQGGGHPSRDTSKQVAYECREIVGPGYSAGPAANALTRRCSQVYRSVARGARCFETDVGSNPVSLATAPGRGEQEVEQNDGPETTVMERVAGDRSGKCRYLDGAPLASVRRKNELERERAERARDEWFNQARPMITTKKTWREKTCFFAGPR